MLSSMMTYLEAQETHAGRKELIPTSYPDFHICALVSIHTHNKNVTKTTIITASAHNIFAF